MVWWMVLARFPLQALRLIPVRCATPGDGVRVEINAHKTGTLGCFVRRRFAGDYPTRHALTCQHVFTDEQATNVVNPGDLVRLRIPLFRKIHRKVVLGRIDALGWDPQPLNNTIDAALVRVDSSMQSEHKPRGIKSISSQPITVEQAVHRTSPLFVQKSGYSTGVTFGRVKTVLRGKVRYPGNVYQYMPFLFQIEAVALKKAKDQECVFGKSGDSGAVVWSYEPKGLARPVGLLCRTKGDKSGRVAYAVPIEHVLNKLDLEILV